MRGFRELRYAKLPKVMRDAADQKGICEFVHQSGNTIWMEFVHRTSPFIWRDGEWKRVREGQGGHFEIL